MKLFTVIMDYCGGTYISQVHAEDESWVLRKWLEGISDEELSQWMLRRVVISSSFRGSRPKPLSGLSNVWCQSATVDDHLVLINIVLTTPH